MASYIFEGVFCVENLPNLLPCQNFPTGQPAKLGKASKARKVLTTKTSVACSHHCPLRHLAPSLGHWYTGVYLRIFDPGPSNPTTFLGLCSPGDYRQSIESPMGIPTFNSTEKALTFIIYDCSLRIRSKKVCYLTKVRPLEDELIWHAPSVECAVPYTSLWRPKG